VKPRTLAFAVFEIVYSMSTRPFYLYLVAFAAVAASTEVADADCAVSLVHLVLVGSENSAGTALDH
jgi:hypothetical protein